MALSQTIKTDWGISVPESYCRVEAVSLVDKESIAFRLRCYTAPADVPFFTERIESCDYILDGPNPIEQAYLHLKSLPEFADATDC